MRGSAYLYNDVVIGYPLKRNAIRGGYLIVGKEARELRESVSRNSSGHDLKFKFISRGWLFGWRHGLASRVRFGVGGPVNF